MTYHPEKLNVSGLFGTFYRIPEFQRQYSWSKDHLEEIVDDIFGDDHWDHNSSYFIGSIVTVKQSGDSAHPFSLIDGQQRLTTISLLIRALLNRVEKETHLDDDTLCSMHPGPRSFVRSASK